MKYPECEKLAAVKDKSQIVGEFIDWLRHEKGFDICEPDTNNDGEEEYYPVTASVEKLLAEFFDIDLDKVEKERRKILADLGKKNA